VINFQDFGKIKRLFRDVVITEKIDGTNAQVFITGANEVGIEGLSPTDPLAILQNTYGLAFQNGQVMYAGSRNRYLNLKEDNYGFARWVYDNQDELFRLGDGRHFGEWWGRGIQRGYDLKEKRLSLFNTHKWKDDEVRPKCCSVVPELYVGEFDTQAVKEVLAKLKQTGSVAAPGFMDAEGVIVYHSASNHLYKYTTDDNHKG